MITFVYHFVENTVCRFILLFLFIVMHLLFSDMITQVCDTTGVEIC